MALLLEAAGRSGGNDEQGDEQGDEQYDEQNDEDEGDWDFSRPIRHCPAPRRDLAGNWANSPHLPGVMVRRSHRIYIQDGNDTNLP